MATTKAPAQKKGKSKTENTEILLKDKYKEYVLTHGNEPNSIFLFTKELGLTEEGFYSHFGSFNAIQSAIWLEFVESTISTIKGDKVYEDYSSRERLLSFYYTLMERLKRDRSYVKYTIDKVKKPNLTPSFLKQFRSLFISYVEELIGEGINHDEIAKRPLITDRYKDGLWLQFIFLIGFWIKDDSAQFEKTDAAIEKSVNLSFELMGHGPLDTMIDFAKFIYQNR